jgi:hypothetical protein
MRNLLSRTPLVLALLAALPGPARALSLAALDGGASLAAPDGSLSFLHFDVTLPSSVGGSPNAFGALDLSLFQVNAFDASLGVDLLQLDGPLVASLGQVGVLQIAFDVVASASLAITGVGLDITGTALGTGALARVAETVDGGPTLVASREGGGAQNPVASASLGEPASQLHIVKDITVDARRGLLAQISEIRQRFDVAPVPEPGGFAIFATGALVVAVASRRRAL